MILLVVVHVHYKLQILFFIKTLLLNAWLKGKKKPERVESFHNIFSSLNNGSRIIRRRVTKDVGFLVKRATK